jgi:hypothetical protein
MMTYYQNPNNDLFYISWNGSSTFHQGYFDERLSDIYGKDGQNGSFIPTDSFTVYGKGEPGGPCTPQEAHDVAEGHFKDYLTT